MDNQRLFLFFALALVLMLIWQAWEQEHAPRLPSVSAPNTSLATAPSGVPDVPKVASSATEAVPAPKTSESLTSGTRLHVRTDLMEIVIDTQGGDVRALSLRHYPVAASKPNEPFPLMRDDPGELFIAQSGLIGLKGNYPNHKTLYSVPPSESGMPSFGFKSGYVSHPNLY